MPKNIDLTAAMSLLAIPWATTLLSTTVTESMSFARSAGIRKEAVMQRQLNESISVAITNKEKGAYDWVLNDLVWELYWWVDFFNITFFREQPVTVPAISFEKTRVTNLGHYVVGKNAFGIKDNINLNSAHLNRSLWDVLVTLVHEMTHSWQAMYGKPSKSWFHNKEFQLKMLEFGIICDSTGRHQGVRDPFVYFLKKHGINFDRVMEPDGIIKIPPKPMPKGKSKLRKWTCGCTNVRVAVKDFEAKCLKCSHEFKQAS
jgi:hypothetical protein